VLDLFAGSGALGIEALSRGAAEVTFVDSDPEAVRVIRSNLAPLADLAARSQVRQGDALQVAASAAFCDLVLADPPYAFDRWPLLLDRLAPRTGLLVAESGSGLDLGRAWETVKVKRYGGTVVTVGRPVTGTDAVRQEGEI
jgi:16S rRNA (guanine966-N2)-methyltransferase